ncbi:MAG TPA: hypothetical protein VGC35_03590 [Allosphingosinicella sp.]|jgi:uncharacterized repeat protein (TIGR01451 family)
MRALFAIFLAVCALAAWPVYANLCATPAKNGSNTIAGVVNTYYAPTAAIVSAGATSISLSGYAGAGQPIEAGDLLLVIQMQDATIDDRNNSRYGDGVSGGAGNGAIGVGQSGLYEYVRAANAVPLTGGTLTIVGGTGAGLANSYVAATPTGTRGKRTFQVVKVPQYDQATVAGTVAALPWNGTLGGVVAIDVARRLTFSGGTVDASGRGFRGGGGRRLTGGGGTSSDYVTLSTNNAHASKGEGLAGTPRFVWFEGTVVDNVAEGLPTGSSARGAPANAGGGGTDGNPIANDENTGGGGGANAGQGGFGGNAWCPGLPTSCDASGGHPGVAVDNLSYSRIVMGGGGGAGTNNDGTGSPANGAASSGAAGGGIVLIRAAEIAGSGSVRANGADANSTVLNDATGGGGAGGSILLSALRTITGASISVQADGGDGGTNTGGGSPHGPGGGGGGGLIVTTTNVLASTSVNGGSNGATVSTSTTNSAYGSSAGTGGAGSSTTTASIPGLSSGGECTPTVTKSFATSPIAVGAATRMSIVVTNPNPNVPLNAVAFTDTYPSGLINTAAPATAISCAGGTLAAAAGAGSLALSGGSVGALSSCTYSVNTTASSLGDKTNTIAALAVSGTMGTTTVRNLEAASAIVQVSAPLTIVKASQVYSDPVNGTANPKAVPGGVLTYTISVANPGSGTVDSGTLVVLDATPANLQLFVGDLISGGGPLVFQQGSTPSALTYTYTSLASTTDDIEFSNNSGSTWTYTPVPNTLGVDPAVTHFRIRPKGAMAGNSSFSVQVRYRVK